MKKGNIVLDLDSTLIYSHPAKHKLTAENSLKAKKMKFYTMDDEKGGVIFLVFERPGLQEFLDYIFEHYNVSVWTAATKSYALWIISHSILKKPGRKLSWIFYDYHGKISEDETKHSKSLRLFWEKGKFELPGHDADNTIIIDDLDEVFETQPDNCIPIPAFKFAKAGSENDSELMKIKSIFGKTPNVTEAVQQFKKSPA